MADSPRKTRACANLTEVRPIDRTRTRSIMSTAIIGDYIGILVMSSVVYRSILLGCRVSDRVNTISLLKFVAYRQDLTSIAHRID
jgi:hypothetical protein